MAVKVTKPKVNIRQKLTELDIPKGAHGTQLVASRSAAETFDIVRADRKNLLYNGEMQINQRGNVTGVTGNQYGGPDRWKAMIASAGTWSISQDGDVPMNQGFARSLKLDCTTSRATLAAGSGLSIAQYLEGYDVAHLAWGTPEAKDLTLSFWLKVDNGVSGTFVILVRNHGSGKLLNRQVRLNREGGWNYYVVNIPADKAGAFSYGNTKQLEIKFTFEAGSNAGGGASGGSMLHQWLAFHNAHTGVGCDLRLANSTGNNLWLTGVQLEAGNEPTTYDHRSYGEELRLCQRYFEKYTASGGNSGRGPQVGAYNSTRYFGYINCSPKRDSNLALGFGGGLRVETINLASATTVSAISDYAQIEGGSGIFLEVNTSSWGSGNTLYHLSFPTNAYITIDSEL